MAFSIKKQGVVSFADTLATLFLGKWKWYY
jgi:hypothetical protein